jgi:hypothetical protein
MEDKILTARWKDFLKKNKLNEKLEFKEIVSFLSSELEPIWKNLINLNQK